MFTYAALLLYMIAFSGEEPVDCRMLGGVSTDFNLMLRRGEWTGNL